MQLYWDNPPAKPIMKLNPVKSINLQYKCGSIDLYYTVPTLMFKAVLERVSREHSSEE